MGSDISGLYKLKPEERFRTIARASGIDEDKLKGFLPGSSAMELLDGMIENVVGTFEIPIGIATNFIINGREVLVPMAIEEPSVVAAASKAAKIARRTGGFTTSSTEPVMIGQVQVTSIDNIEEASEAIEKAKSELMAIANDRDPVLVKFGGGLKDIGIRKLKGDMGDMIVIHLLVDCRDAMGANAVNTMAEALAPELERLTGGRVVLRIISNLAVHRLSRAAAVFPKDELGGDEGVDLILWAQSLARVDPFRASTHNKGVMNGVSAVVRATGNDTRAVEAGVHSYAAHGGGYGPVTSYHRDDNGDLVGSIEIPTAVGLVGGATKVHPAARSAVELLGVKTARELGEILAAVGLAQNLAALRALSHEGIQKGHMKLHARNLALQAGAEPHEVEEVVARMIGEGSLTASSAEDILRRMRDSDRHPSRKYN